MPWRPLPEMMLRSCGVVPPMTLSEAPRLIRMPSRPLPSVVVPSVPIRQPRTVLPVANSPPMAIPSAGKWMTVRFSIVLPAELTVRPISPALRSSPLRMAVPPPSMVVLPSVRVGTASSRKITAPGLIEKLIVSASPLLLAISMASRNVPAPDEAVELTVSVAAPADT